MIEISRNKNLKIEQRIALLKAELKQLDFNIEKLDRDFLINHEKLWFKMSYTRSYLETYLDTDFTTNNCNDYRSRIILGFSPQNDYPKMAQIPEVSYKNGSP